MKRAMMTEGRSKAFDLTIPVPMGFSVSFAATFDQEVEALAREIFSESRYESLRSKWTGMTNPLVGDPRERQLARDAEAFFSDERFKTFDRMWGDRKVVNPLAGKSESPQLI